MGRLTVDRAADIFFLFAPIALVGDQVSAPSLLPQWIFCNSSARTHEVIEILACVRILQWQGSVYGATVV